MPAPKIKVKFKTTLNTGLTLTALLVILAEAYLGYMYIFKNLTYVPVPPSTEKIVRVNTADYKATITLLDNLKNFLPETPQPSNLNPLK